MIARIRFGTFDADLVAGELYREGRLVPLQQQPFEVLRALVEQPGEVVTREALRRRLWPDGTIVDFDQSLNKSLTKLRDALGDSASNPRFVQTLPKRGYRFIAPITVPATPSETIVQAETMPAPPERPTLPTRPRSIHWHWAATATVAAALCTLVIAGTSIRLAQAGPHATGTSTTALPGFSPIPAAHDAYERGRRALARGSDRCIRQSVELFGRAVDLSPKYAAAYAALAHAHLMLAAIQPEDAADGVARAREAATRAIAIDPNQPAAYAALGRLAVEHDRDWRGAEVHLQRSIALDPGYAEARAWYATALSEEGRDEEAEAEARRALAADPHALTTNTAMGAVLYRAGRHAEAAMALERAVEIDPDYAPARRLLVALRERSLASSQPIADLRSESPK